MKRLSEFLGSFAAPVALAAATALCLCFAAVWFGGLNQDEGWYLYAAQMVRSGYMPYRDFFYTQGPAMPFVYSVLSPLWGRGALLQGLLGGRIVTLAFGLLGGVCAVALARRLVPHPRRGVAGLTVFALLLCNLYHLYFVTIPKTYALGGLFVMAGFLLVARGLESGGPAAVRPTCLFAGGLSLAFATGTRISLLLILPVVGVTLLVRFREFRWSFLVFGLGGALGLALTYGVFALDPESLRGLLAAQRYHAARGGFDPFFVIGSVSRLARGYVALGVVLFAVPLLRRWNGVASEAEGRGAAAGAVAWMLGLGFAAVFALQLSAPFPYDDYQVPVMPMLAVLAAALFARSVPEGASGRAAWFVALTAAATSFASPLLQEWATFSNDRFWSQKKEMTELAKLRLVGRDVEALDPGGRDILTQDLYLAVETGRAVPRGLEMGPFSYFPDLPTDEARAVHVLNRELMDRLIDSAPCAIAACSGYAFAIAAPHCDETPFEEQRRYFKELDRRYEPVYREIGFGQNATTLLVYRRRPSEKEAQR